MGDESASAATGAVRATFDLAVSASYTGFSISLKIDNPIIAGLFTVGALSLGAFYLANRRSVEDALRNALEFRNEAGVVDPEVRNIEGGSILVDLHCHSELSFLQFVEDFEAEKVKHRLVEEFTKIGFQRKLRVTIRNADEVNKKVKVIRLSHKESKTEKLEDNRVRKVGEDSEVYSGKDPKENLQIQLREMEQQLTNVLRETQQQEENSQRQLREIQQQVARIKQQWREQERLSSKREQQLTNLKRQLREKELKEANLQLKLREKDQQEENSQRQLREIQQQLREKEEQEENLQSQLREMEQQLREEEDQKENLQRQLREVEQRLTNLQGQFRENEDEMANLQEQVTTLDRQLNVKDRQVNELEITLSAAQQALIEHQRRQVTPDWVTSRDQIQLTDKLLGRGSWGSVVEGKYCGCSVAVKQIHELILSPHNRSLFEREMEIASRCRHPCLLQFIAATNDEGSPLFVTELMESSLRALLEQRPLSATEVSIISLDVARALNYLHQKKPSPIVHRDISSANVLLWRQGDHWRGKVADYGTANFMQHTMTVAPGSVIYIAPEALTSNQTVKVDVYSFGVLLCEMCIRELPDPERRDQQIAMVTNRLLRALIRGCLQSEPEARPNMEEIIEELEEPV